MVEFNCLFQKDQGKTASAARILSANPMRRPLPCLLIQSLFLVGDEKPDISRKQYTNFRRRVEQKNYRYRYFLMKDIASFFVKSTYVYKIYILNLKIIVDNIVAIKGTVSPVFKKY